MSVMDWTDLEQVNANAEEEVEQGTNETAKVNSLEAEIKKTLENLKAEVNRNKGMYDELYKYSDMLEVVQTYGWTDKGSFIDRGTKEYKKDANGNFLYDANGKKIKDRDLVTVPALVGYKLKNVGDHTFTYTQKCYSRDESGNIVYDTVTKELAPGETAIMTKEDAAIFASQPGINCKIKNGKFVLSGKKSSSSSAMSILKNAHFIADSGSGIYVNAENFKIQVGIPEGTDEKGEKIYRVKPEYFEVFGGLEIVKTRKKRESAASADYDLKSATIAQIISNAANEVYKK